MWSVCVSWAVRPPVVVPVACFVMETVRRAGTVVSSSTVAVVEVGVTTAFVMHCTAQPVPAEMIGPPSAEAVPVASASIATAAAASFSAVAARVMGAPFGWRMPRRSVVTSGAFGDWAALRGDCADREGDEMPVEAVALISYALTCHLVSLTG